jgi:hypothetical protein
MENETPKKKNHLLIFALLAIVAWIAGTFAFVYYYPHLMYNALEKSVTGKGLTPAGVPVNTFYAVPTLASPTTAKSNVLIDGTTHDTLYDIGVLDLSKEALVLHVPDMGDRYYSIEFVDVSDGTDFAYVGTRTTGSTTADYLITGPSWKGTVPQDMKQISSPNNSVLVIGRVLVESDSDMSAAYGLSKQIELTPLGQWLVSGSQGIPAK